MNDCPVLADTGSDGMVLVPLAVVLLVAGGALVVWGRRQRGRKHTFLLAVIVCVGLVMAAGGSVPAIAASAQDCPPHPSTSAAASTTTSTPTPSPAPSQTGAPTPSPTSTQTPAPSPTGEVSVADIAVTDWLGDCPPASSTCTFTVNLATTGAVTTNPGATIDWSSLAITGVPPGYSFDPVVGSTLTVHVTTQSQPATLPTYTVDDTTGTTSNAATIRLPVIGTVITAPPLGTSAAGAVPWPVTGSTCDVDGCSSTIDLSSYVGTSNPEATIDWSTLDLDPSTPGVQQTFTAPGETITFNPTTRMITFLVGYCYIPVGTSYTVSDTNGVQSTPSAIEVFTTC